MCRPGSRHESPTGTIVAMSRHIQVTFDAHDPRALSSFWRDALGYVHPAPPGVALPEGADPLAAWDEFLARAGVPEDQRNTRSAIEDPDGDGPRLFFQQVPEDKVAKNRVHLDVRAAPGLEGEERMAALEQECERLVALGATRVRRNEPEPSDECRLHRDDRPRGQRVLPGLTSSTDAARAGTRCLACRRDGSGRPGRPQRTRH